MFTLHLPAHWQLAPGVSRPEVGASHKRRDRDWVVTGDAWYVVYESEHKWALELAVRLRPLPRKPSTRQGKTAAVAGHVATLTWSQKRRGLPWRRHDVTFMRLDFDCPYSERSLRLEFSGWCPREGFLEVLEALHHLRCH